MSATNPRPDGEGGWLCEVGTAWLEDRPNSDGFQDPRRRADPRKVCNRPAHYIRAGVDSKHPKPGTVVCAAHLTDDEKWLPLLRVAAPPEDTKP